jgi:hypothetical protein
MVGRGDHQMMGGGYSSHFQIFIFGRGEDFNLQAEKSNFLLYNIFKILPFVSA